MKFVQITDLNILYSALREEEVYKTMLGIEDLSTWVPDIISTRWFLLQDGDNYVGITAIHQETNNLYGFHGSIYEPYRNKSIEYAKAGMKIVKDFTGGQLITTQPAANKAASILVRKCGMKLLGVVKNGYKNDDMNIFVEKD